MDDRRGRLGAGRLISRGTSTLRLSLLVLLVSLAVAAPAAAQLYESVGTRAQGMGGAFVAVADDATASWWNPAGLATGAYFSALLEYDRRRDDTSFTGFSLALPALALSYYRLPLNEIRSLGSTGQEPASRQDQGVLSQWGATVGQSLGDHLAVAATLKLLRASDTKGDLDLGAMATFGRSRLGVTVKNVTAPQFADGLLLQRHVRGGLAFNTSAGGRLPVTAAFDADLTKTATVVGVERRLAMGTEVWMPGGRVGVRGGLNVSGIGDRRAAASLGVSVGVTSTAYLDGQVTRGSDSLRRGAGLSFRVTF